ncbi:MAG: aldehyde ferredoxin oxidoreductase family protein [Chloroflexi bacterium]|nr:aldehyde ferredoxin oxidoreductase family protein [Chloroflexota bacterium]
MNGWAGQRLKVYLTEGKIVKEPLPEELRLNFLGGRGLNSKTLFDELKPGVDPLSPDNIVMVGVGPLNGTAAPGFARWTVTAKSTVALPGGLGDGNGGGDFATELKFAGYDQVIFYGRSPKPVYLLINNDHVELRDAANLWGKTNPETNKQLWKELGDREVRVLSIGPAGENLVRLAKCFSNMTRAGGKGGIGAVMGSKNLKAVAVRGTGSVEIARPAEFHQAVKHGYDKLLSSPQMRQFRETGSLSTLRSRNLIHALSTRNGQSGYFEGFEPLTVEVFESKYAVKHHGCSACPISCSHYYQVPEGRFACHGESNEYGTTYPFGSKCGNNNLAAILKMDRICDELGLDTHSTGNTMCFAMHCWQEGLLTAKDTGGIDLSWGNYDSMLQLLPMIAYRQGFGNLLAEGSFRASQQIKGSEICRKTVKGLEISSLYLGPVTSAADGLAYATSTRGADHRRGLGRGAMTPSRLARIMGSQEAVDRMSLEPRAIEGKGILMAQNQDFTAFFNALIGCAWLTTGGGPGRGLDVDDLTQLFSTATDVDMNEDDAMKIGERIYNVERAFNIREGMRRKDDYLPKSFLFEKETPWGMEGITEANYSKLLDEYYQFRGCNLEGIPTRQKLGELGLSDVAEQIGAVEAAPAR